MFVALVSLALAAAPPPPVPEPRVWVGIGLTGVLGASGAPGGGGGAGVEAGARLGKEPRRALALVARVRESLVSSPVRNLGTIDVLAQYPSGTGPHASLGFTHNHESSLDAYLADPIGVTAGVAPTLTHRSGFAVGVGWDFPPPFPRNRISAGLRPTAAIHAQIFPDGPPVYLAAEIGARFGLDPLFGG